MATEINLHVPSLLPALYCSDVHERLVLYKRLANCESADELQSMQEELVDRFGSPPEPAQALLACHRLRLVAKPKGISKVDAGPERTTISFVKNPPFDPSSLIALVQKDGRIRFAGPDRVRIERAAPIRKMEDHAIRMQIFPKCFPPAMASKASRARSKGKTWSMTGWRFPCFTARHIASKACRCPTRMP